MLTDVELLVNFFRRAIPSLAPHGSIIVTIFEGMPYTLWNIRDLARHSGLAVERSFKFQAAAYPGYHHARTLGVVKTGAGEPSVTGWKGEERPARSFVFVKKEDVAPVAAKRRRGDDDSESENDTRAMEDESEVEDVETHSSGRVVGTGSGGTVTAPGYSSGENTDLLQNAESDDRALAASVLVLFSWLEKVGIGMLLVYLFVCGF